MTWLGIETGAYLTTITFKVATAITDDGEGGAVQTVGDLIIPIRLVPMVGGDINRIIEQFFPGDSAYQYAFWGWVNDKKNYSFPPVLRQQTHPVGGCTLEAGAGRMRCSVGAFANPYAAKRVGEKFAAIWTGT